MLKAATTLCIALVAMAEARAAIATAVFWAADPVRPDQTVLICGEGFGERPGVELVRLGDSTPGTPRR